MKIAALAFIVIDAFILGYWFQKWIREEHVSVWGVGCSVIGIILLTSSLF